MWNEARKRRKAQFSAASDKSYDFTKTKTFDNSNENKKKEKQTPISTMPTRAMHFPWQQWEVNKEHFEMLIPKCCVCYICFRGCEHRFREHFTCLTKLFPKLSCFLHCCCIFLRKFLMDFVLVCVCVLVCVFQFIYLFCWPIDCYKHEYMCNDKYTNRLPWNLPGTSVTFLICLISI